MQYVSNQNGTRPLADNHRHAELAALLNAAVARVARQVLVQLPWQQRSKDDSQFLMDCARSDNQGRRVASPTTVARLMALAARADLSHAWSDAVRAVEVQVAPAGVPVAEEANEAEQLANEALNMAQLQAEREKSPTRWLVVWELCKQQMHATRRLMDAAASRAFGHARAQA